MDFCFDSLFIQKIKLSSKNIIDGGCGYYWHFGYFLRTKKNLSDFSTGKNRSYAICLFLSFFYLLTACGKWDTKSTQAESTDSQGIQTSYRNYTTPTRKVDESEIPFPFFIDDMEFNNMDIAIKRQLEYFQRFRLLGTITFGNDSYPRSMLPISLQLFQRLYHTYRRCMVQAQRSRDPKRENIICKLDFHSFFLKYFNVYEPNVDLRQEKPVQFTGYYTLTILASRRRTHRFKYPIYSNPGRNSPLRRSTSHQINFQNALRGHELIYTDNLLPVYTAQIQGHAKVQFIDGARDAYLHYDGDNGRALRNISTYMTRRGMISNRSYDAQKQYLDENPHRQAEVYRHSPSYVYFRLEQGYPTGNIGVPVTDHRSIATDRYTYTQKGVLAFVTAERSNYKTWEETGENEMIPFSRFVLDQDTGGEIKGKAEVDLYFGQGDYAHFAAHRMKNHGNMFFLMPKLELFQK